MARMYGKSKGKSASKKPAKKTVQPWMGYKPKEVELLVVKLAKEGKTPSQIGLFMRDTYGVPDVKTLTKKSISQILSEKKLLSELPEDLMAVIRKNISIRKHLEENHTDKVAKRGLQIAESRIMSLVKYYKDNKRIKQSWKYDPDKIRLLIE